MVAPSLKPEPFGRVVIEAQAMARLVIVADAGGGAETVEHNRTGWRFPPGDVAMLALAIDTGLGLDASQRLAFGDAARASVHAHYATSRMQAATLNIYRELLAPGR